MFIKENIMLAIAGLKSNKMRAVLTMLGIIIGIGSVIGIVSVGNAMTANVTSSMADMGSTNVTINVTERDSTSTNNNKTKTNEKKNGSSTNEMPGAGSHEGGAGGGIPGGGSGGGMPGGGMSGGGGMPGGGGGMPGGGMGGHSGRFGSSSTSTPKDSDLLTMSQIKELEENFGDEIDAFSVTATKDTGKAKSGTAYANVNITGTNPGYEKVKNIEMADGRYITDTDVDGSKMVAVVSDKLVSKIFGEGADPIGQEVKIYTSSAIHCYTIVGVYTYKSS
ncbi:MAG: ABC transporter permease, partial [Clostridium butyricum]